MTVCRGLKCANQIRCTTGGDVKQWALSSIDLHQQLWRTERVGPASLTGRGGGSKPSSYIWTHIQSLKGSDMLYKRLVFYPNSVTKPTNQSIYCNFSACVWPSRSQPIWQEQLRALYLFCQRTHSHLTQIQDSAKGPPDGNMPRLHCLQVSLVSRSGRNGNIFSACNESVAPKVSWHFFFCCFYSKQTKKKQKTKLLSVTSVQ